MNKIIFLLLVLSVVLGCSKREEKNSKTKVDVRWFVGLGAGSDEPTFEPQRKVVEEFNASQDEINLILEIVENSAAVDTLAVQLTSGNAPDIVGPVGIEGRDSFKGTWEDLQPYVDKYGFDLSAYDKKLVQFYNDDEDGLVGIPFAVYPSFLYINKDLFDEAGLPYPPQNFGEEYIDENGVSKVWDVNTMRELANKLTVDSNGNDSNSNEFDPEKIVQFGFGPQWFSPKQLGTLFGSGHINQNGNAKIPDNWVESWKFFYDGMWNDYWTPSQPYQNSDLLANGDLFASGNVAMVHTHLWYAGFMEVDFNWNTAVVPSFNGVYTAALNADTFEIPKLSKNKDAAFKVMMYLVDNASLDLLNIYGGMPARKELQDTYLQGLKNGRFKAQNINWDVATESLKYADVPSYESWLPNFIESETRLGVTWSNIMTTKGLDIDNEVTKLENDLQSIFNSGR